MEISHTVEIHIHVTAKEFEALAYYSCGGMGNTAYLDWHTMAAAENQPPEVIEVLAYAKQFESIGTIYVYNMDAFSEYGT